MKHLHFCVIWSACYNSLLPLGVINLPLGVINLPLGVINLPLGVINLLLGVINLPLGVINLPAQLGIGVVDRVHSIRSFLIGQCLLLLLLHQHRRLPLPFS